MARATCPGLVTDDDDPVAIIGYRPSTMMDGIADMALRHGDRRARAYERNEPVIRCIQDAITTYRRDGGDRDGRPTIGALIAACSASGLTAARGGPVTRYTICQALKLTGLS